MHVVSLPKKAKKARIDPDCQSVYISEMRIISKILILLANNIQIPCSDRDKLEAEFIKFHDALYNFKRVEKVGFTLRELKELFKTTECLACDDSTIPDLSVPGNVSILRSLLSVGKANALNMHLFNRFFSTPLNCNI